MISEEKIIFPNSKGDRLIGILSTPKDNTGSVVILCHGFTTSKNSPTYISLAKSFADQRIATFRFDFFGHGESEGKFGKITVTEGADDILNAIKYLKFSGYKKIALAGKSFGGISSAIAATKTNDLIALALISPVSDYPEVKRARRSETNIAEWKKTGFTIHKNSKGQEFKLDYSFWEDIQKNIVYDVADLIKIPTLIIHGDADKTVLVNQSRKTAKLIPDCKYIEVSGVDHQFSNPDNFGRMIKEVTDFIVDKLK